MEIFYPLQDVEMIVMLEPFGYFKGIYLVFGHNLDQKFQIQILDQQIYLDVLFHLMEMDLY
jgi:hypothetical protein